MKQNQYPEIKFKSAYSGLTGVGGWLALFIVGQTVLRPLLTVSQYFNDKTVNVSQIAERFPTTATLITIERILIIHLIIFGIAVGLALWKVRTPFSVKLAKIYLIVNPVFLILDGLMYKLSDLPPTLQDKIVQQGLRNAGIAALWCLLWFLYFIKSDRVKATYYDNSTPAPER